ncbi:MAG: flagellar motor protein MotB [Pseudomonadota bacterium]
MASDEATTIIVKKKSGKGGDGHHGGAWKVAYADFVTAMMAFFLLMWLLNATSEEQRKGIADYFSPKLPISDVSSGGQSLFGGESAASSETLSRSGVGGRTSDDEDGEGEGESAAQVAAPDPASADPLINAMAFARAEIEREAEEIEAAETAEILIEAIAAQEERLAIETADAVGPYARGETIEDRADLQEALGDPAIEAGERAAMRAAYEAIEEIDEAGELLRHLSMRVTPEGLLIEIAETARTPLFASGSAEPSEVMRSLMEAIGPVIAQLENKVAIVGHTDAQPFAAGSARTNWTLSAERADAARQLLISAGLPETRMARISGAADRSPLVDDVFAPENRRIGLTLLRETPKRSRPLAPAVGGTTDLAPRSNGGGAEVNDL